MFPTLIRRTVQEKVPYIYTNTYKAKRLWPPDFKKISPKHQFRLERRYKRRAKLKWARPQWTKGVKLVQMASVTFVAVYGVLFLEWMPGSQGQQPFQEIRDWFFGLRDTMGTKDQIPKQEPEKAATAVTNVDR